MRKLPVEIDIASEFRYRGAPLEPGDLAIFISQSGETADTLATLRYARENKQHILSVVNVPTSTIARESDVVMPTLGRAGNRRCLDQGLHLPAQRAGLPCDRGGPRARRAVGRRRAEAGARADRGAAADGGGACARAADREACARTSPRRATCFISGRGTSFPIALEGALKLKEISYIHAEGYAAGELKHGPIALIDENMPVIVIAPHDASSKRPFRTCRKWRRAAARSSW